MTIGMGSNQRAGGPSVSGKFLEPQKRSQSPDHPAELAPAPRQRSNLSRSLFSNNRGYWWFINIMTTARASGERKVLLGNLPFRCTRGGGRLRTRLLSELGQFGSGCSLHGGIRICESCVGERGPIPDRQLWSPSNFAGNGAGGRSLGGAATASLGVISTSWNGTNQSTLSPEEICWLPGSVSGTS